MGLIMITHNIGVVAETADRVVVQYKGRKMEEAGVLALFDRAQERPTPARCSRRCPRTPPATACRPSAISPTEELRSDGATVLEASNLVRDYHVGGGLFGASRTVHAVQGVSFSLDKGKTLAIVGETGSRQVDAGPHPDADRPRRPRASC